MGLCIVAFIIVYFFVDETKGVPMEELAALFGDTVVVHLTEDRLAISEEVDPHKVAAIHVEEVAQDKCA